MEKCYELAVSIKPAMIAFGRSSKRLTDKNFAEIVKVQDAVSAHIDTVKTAREDMNSLIQEVKKV